MAKSKSAKKKNHVSKHILKNRQDDGAAGADETKSSTAPKKKKSKANSHVKHPDEAFSYLQQWKANKSESSSTWKFNKNTQSWLIRHMYEVDKVPKSSFTLLTEYLEGLEGNTIKERMRADATRRCRRYKEYSKNNSDSKSSSDAGDGATNEQTRDPEDEKEVNYPGEDDGPTSSTKTKNDDETTELEYEERMWQKLDDHEKRKQYKRARKILDLMKKM